MKSLSLIVLTLTGGCIISNSPHRWAVRDHIEMMNECRAACGGYVSQYKPLTGECLCKQSRKK